MAPFRTTLLATGLIAVAFGSWYGYFLLPVLLVAVLVCGLRLLISFFSRGANPLSELGWLLLCAGALPLIFVGRELRVQQIEDRWAPTLAALNAGADPGTVERPDDECALRVERGSPGWGVSCQLTPPFERMTWDHGDQRFYIWD